MEGNAGTATEANLLPNASFEEVEKPLGWSPHTWHGQGEFTCAPVGRTGGRSVRIASKKGGDLSWETTVSVKPYSVYRLSGWIKTEKLKPKDGAGALINVHGMREVHTPPLKGTNDWTRVEVTFETGEQDSIEVNCLFGGWGSAAGTAWYDDVALEFVSAKELKLAVAIDAAKEGAPISKYIYGQFIEHLGRCIYGGIWAEMLEDRKFYYPVGAAGSAWRAVGDPGRIKMIEQEVYVGTHTPVVQLAGDGTPRGILQDGLGLVQGKEYTGHVVLAGDATAAPVEVSLVWADERGDEPGARETVAIDAITAAYATRPLRFTVGADTDKGRLEIVSRGNGLLRIGTLSLMPADNVNGMRADTLALLKELDAPVYRWPGGNFVSGYNWKDGIGERDRRPPRKNPAWEGLEHNDFGLDEFLAFCREIDTEPFITVNSGLGNVDEAVEELEYANGAADTPMGKLRAANAHPEPYSVKWWAIGNEMYGNWQLGKVPLDNYARKHNEFAEAMRAQDPNIKLIAVGATGKWSEGMLAQCAGHMDLLSEHFYRGEAKGLLSHVRQIPDAVRHKATMHRRYHKEIPAIEGTFIPIALDEWNYWYGPELYGQIGPRYFLKDALGIAAGLHEYTRHSDVFFMANYAQTVNVIGAIKTNKTAAEFDTTGLVLKLYRRHYGTIPVAVGGDCAPLDVAAAWTQDRTALTVGIVNPCLDAQKVPVRVDGASLTGSGRVWTITGTDPMAYNEPGVPPAVRIEEKEVDGISDALDVGPISVTLYALAVK